MNRFESDQWAKSGKLQVLYSLKEHGSALSGSINAVLNNCSLSDAAKQELKACLRKDEAELSRYLKDNGL
jgi:hypothetical protein|tara:strand:+ start:195 stop:404 length:210 start_codon:yes stop_codon:yes gene_type:complete